MFSRLLVKDLIDSFSKEEEPLYKTLLTSNNKEPALIRDNLRSIKTFQKNALEQDTQYKEIQKILEDNILKKFLKEQELKVAIAEYFLDNNRTVRYYKRK